jgi:hypothetical protein
MPSGTATMRIRSFVLATSLCIASGLALAAEFADFTGLQQNMTPQEFQNAGLNKLSPEELANLDAWLKSQMRQREAVVAAAPRPDRSGFHEEEDRTPIQSRILGEFRGWQGGARFELENGQVWLQAEPGELSGVKVKDPVVTITPGMLGVWKLKIKGYNSTVKVHRIK